jgi:3-oxoadipate enol-lactonase
MTSGTLQIDQQTSLFFTSHGDQANPSLILIHGFPMDHTMWSSQIKHLEKNFHVIAYDLRGMGQSKSKDPFAMMESHVDDLIALTTHLRIQKAHIVGFSMGGYLALRAMERNPALFSSLILIDTQSAADSNEAKLKRFAAMNKIKTSGQSAYAKEFLKGSLSPQNAESNPTLVNQLEKMIMTNSTEGVLSGLFALISRTDTTESLSKIQVPTLIMVGEHDKITPLTAAQAMQSKISNAALHTIPNAGHISPMENPSQVNVVLFDFLKNR